MRANLFSNRLISEKVYEELITEVDAALEKRSQGVIETVEATTIRIW